MTTVSLSFSVALFASYLYVALGSRPTNDEGDILVRKYGETIYNTISSVAAVAIDYPKGKWCSDMEEVEDTWLIH